METRGKTRIQEGLTAKNMAEKRIRIMENGPYVVSGGVPLRRQVIEPRGGHYEYVDAGNFDQRETYALCRCGHSKDKPYCDGSHVTARFGGDEVASREPYSERAEMQFGPDLTLADDGRCAFARFCHRDEGSVWELTGRSDDPYLRQEAITAASECPAGRLVAYDENLSPIEPDLPEEIVALEDPQKGCSGPLYVKGGVTLEGTDGWEYESRNRMALCRCGHSHNMPFCDASHVDAGTR